MTDHQNTFKECITAGWATTSAGDVASPTGYFAIIEWPDNTGELAELVEAIEAGSDAEGIEPGYYVTWENEDGILHWIKHESSQSGRLVAFRQYRRMLRNFSVWNSRHKV